MRKRRNTILIIAGIMMSIVLIVSAFLSSGQEVNVPQKKVSIALITRTASDDYWHYLQRGADSAAQELKAQITVYAPTFDGDVEGQLKTAYAVLQANHDAIIIGANADDAFSAFLTEATRLRIPVIAVDSQITSGVTTSYVGSNNFLAGQQAMDEMAQLINNSGKIIIVNYKYGGINASLREAGVLEQLEQYEGIELVRRVECDAELEDCKQKVKWVYDNSAVDGVIALMNKPAHAAALALKEVETDAAVKIVGFDSSNALLELMQEGYMQTLFVQNPFTQGYLSVQQAVDVVEGKMVQAKIPSSRR